MVEEPGEEVVVSIRSRSIGSWEEEEEEKEMEEDDDDEEEDKEEVKEWS